MEQRYGDLIIRDVTVDDAEQLCLWWNDGAVMAHAGFPLGLGLSVDAVRAQIEDNKTGSASQNYRHIILYQNVPIGEMNYRETDVGVCEIGIKICDASMQNKGLGKVILSLFIGALFEEYGYRKIILDTNLNNKRAQHVYEQLGFQKLRVNENSWRDQLGNLQSSVDYALTRTSFVSFL